MTTTRPSLPRVLGGISPIDPGFLANMACKGVLDCVDVAVHGSVEAWVDRQMKALEPFDVTLTFCFTPESAGLRPHYTSPPKDVNEFADFCARMIRRSGPPSQMRHRVEKMPLVSSWP